MAKYLFNHFFNSSYLDQTHCLATTCGDCLIRSPQCAWCTDEVSWKLSIFKATRDWSQILSEMSDASRGLRFFLGGGTMFRWYFCLNSLLMVHLKIERDWLWFFLVRNAHESFAEAIQKYIYIKIAEIMEKREVDTFHSLGSIFNFLKFLFHRCIWKKRNVTSENLKTKLWIWYCNWNGLAHQLSSKISIYMIRLWQHSPELIYVWTWTNLNCKYLTPLHKTFFFLQDCLGI